MIFFVIFSGFQKIRLKGFLLLNLPRKPPWASLARSVPKASPTSLARSVPKPSPPEAISSRQRPPPPAMRSPKPQAGRRWRGTRYDSPKLIVVGEVRVTTPQS